MNSFRLDGKVALVTGASDGIGFAMACGLAEAGAKIVFNGRSQEKIDAAVARYAENGFAATVSRGHLKHSRCLTAVPFSLRPMGTYDTINQMNRDLPNKEGSRR